LPQRPRRDGDGLDGWSWAVFFTRWVLGLIFLMAGWWKVFDLGPAEHARRYFLQEGFVHSWIPVWLLWAVGVTVPFVELVAGGLVCLGLRRRESLLALGAILVIVTYGHLLLEPLYSITGHIFVRLALLVFVLAAPPGRDVLSVDHWLGRRRGIGEAEEP
jgi:thiosulfate dehydrogenase (quinone) large subunit